MEKCQELVRTYVATEGEDVLKELVDNINSQNITLIHVVKSLGEYLTNDDGKIREKGVKLLSSTLAQCQPERISKQSTRVLVTFYREKIQDSDTVVPGLEGLLTLSSLSTFGANEAADTVTSITEHIKMNAHVQSTRYTVFRIIDVLLAKHLEALKATPSFLPGYIKLAEGEKDPRNLLVAFNIAKVIILEFDISSHVDDLFDITFCYFPITFKPPPNDPYGITTEDLKSALRECLSSTPRFGPLALPLFLEKLSATSPQTKRETLKTLRFCLPVYGSTVAKGFAPQMWSAFKLEIFQPLDSDTATKAVDALTALLLIIYQDKASAPQSEVDSFEGLAEEVITECIRLLKEPEKNQAQHAIKIINACIDTTPNICSYTLKRTIPFLITQFNDPDEASHRDPILAALRDILHAINELPEGLCRDSAASFLEANKDAILGALTAGLRAKVSRGSALSGLLQIVSVQGVLSPEEMAFTVHNINELLDAKEDELEDLRPIALEVLNAIAHVTPKPIEETTLPMLFAALPDHAPARDADDERAKYWATLSALSTLSVPSTLFEVLVIRLSTKLDIICAVPPGDREGEAAYALALLGTISSVISRKVEAGHADIPKYLDRLLPTLFRLTVKAATSTNPTQEVATHSRLIPATSTIITLIVRSSPAAKQAEFAKAVSKLFYNGQTDLLGPQAVLQTQFQPFKENSSLAQRNLVSLFTASLVPLRPEVALPFDSLPRTLSDLVEWCISDSTTDSQSASGIQLVSSLVNKHTEATRALFEDYLPNLWQDIASSPRQVNKLRIRVLKVWAAVARALVVRNHPKGDEYTDEVFRLLEDHQIGKEAGKIIGGIPLNNDGILSKQNYSVVRLFALQKFCSRVLPRVIAGYKESGDAHLRESYLVALAALIRAVPKATYVHLLPTLVPILLLGLSLQDADLRVNVFETLLQVAKDSVEVAGNIGSGPLVEHAGSLVKASLANIQLPEAGNPRVQVCALQLLAVLPSTLRYDLLHPYKAQVIRQLGVALDDRKRAVRKEAVDCRAIWYQFNG